MFSDTNVGIVVSARMGSSRLPGKSLLPFGDVPLVLYLLRRLSSNSSPFRLILATTELPQDDLLARTVSSSGFDVYRGHPTDLVSRYLEVIKHFNLSHVIRVTGDCPFVDYALALQFIEYALPRLSSYFLVSTKGTYPVGLDFEAFSSLSLFRLANSFHLDALEREHLTLGFYSNLPREVLFAPTPYPCFAGTDNTSFTIDTPSDYEFALRLISRFPDSFPAERLFS